MIAILTFLCSMFLILAGLACIIAWCLLSPIRDDQPGMDGRDKMKD